MAQKISRHLFNAAILVLSAAIAVAAERLATAAPKPLAAVGGGAGADISGFVLPLAVGSLSQSFRTPLRYDPFESWLAGGEAAVASTPSLHTVPTSRLLTAILLAEDRRVAVIDDQVVRVGDVLLDGARVSAIQSNRVFVIDSKGRSQTLTLTNRGQ